ncbi:MULTISPECIES: GNAT family N-acetyltransferase [Tissierellales]|jgi:N-acetylglutamate synthase-like GNAT family acetyltransferase|nr:MULTISPECIES: GNAT family N-acetyltransferase [Tissierellales]SCL82535.1 hypothetical protein PP176A_0280 [Sporanaerobacter sp. PP17-6a]
MIKLTSVKSKEEEKAVIEFLENYFLRNNFDTNGLTYMMIEDNKLVGVCGVDIEGYFNELKYVIVSEKRRGLNYGEALLRSVMFNMEDMGYFQIFYQDKNDYLLKKGFSETNESNGEKTFSLKCDIPYIMNKKCCNGAGSNGI